MMKRSWMIGMLAAMLLLLSACGAKQGETPPQEQNEPETSQQEETPQTGEETPQSGTQSEAPAAKAVVSVGYASDALLADPAAFDSFTDDDSDYQIKAAFTVNTAVKDFRYVELGFDEEGQGEDPIRFHVARELYGAAELSSERPLVISMALTGLIPNRGITYVDETGTERYFTLEMSGEDSSLRLSEFFPN